MLRMLRSRRLDDNNNNNRDDDELIIDDDEQKALILGDESEPKPSTAPRVVPLSSFPPYLLPLAFRRRFAALACKRWRGLTPLLLLGLLTFAAIRIRHNPYRIARNAMLLEQLYNVVRARFWSDHRPDLFQCTGGCLQVVSKYHQCLGEFVSLHHRGVVLPQNDKATSGWANLPLASAKLSQQENIRNHATTVNGTLIFMHDKRVNIINAFHHTLWNVLAYGSMPENNQDLTIAYKIEHLPWVEYVLLLAAEVYGWNLINVIHPTSSSNSTSSSSSGAADASNHGWLCTANNDDNEALIVGTGRSLRHYGYSELPRIRNELRARALERTIEQQQAPQNMTTTSTREQIVIYTRQGMKTRVIRNVEILVDLFRQDDFFDIRLVHHMPQSAADQIALFASIDLLIAADNGWAPNVLWMKDGACLVELQQYRRNSWLRLYGMEKLFERGHLMTLTGNYFNKSQPDKKWIPRQWGGLDDFQAELLVPDVRRALRRSRKCRRFLK